MLTNWVADEKTNVADVSVADDVTGSDRIKIFQI